MKVRALASISVVACSIFELSTTLYAYEAPSGSAAAVREIDFGRAANLNEDYHSQFSLCDTQNVFRGVHLSGFRKCSGDKNNVEALLRFPNGTIFFEAKMSLDIDGSWKACNSPGLADLCPTSYRWPNLTDRASFLDSERIPFIVIPTSGPDRWKTEFRETSGVKIGDFAVVVFNGHIVPALVGDGGPFNKLGEASNAVFKAVGKDRCRETNSDGHCTRFLDASVESDVLYFVFPGTASSHITPDNALEMMKSVVEEKLEALKSN